MDTNHTQEIKEIEMTIKRLFNKPICLRFEIEQAKRLIDKWKRLNNWIEATSNPIAVTPDFLIK